MTHGSEVRARAVHATAVDSLPFLANGSLAGPLAAGISAHVDGCPECSRLLAFDAALSGAIREDAVVDYAPHAAFAKLTSRIDAFESRSRFWRRCFHPLGRLGTYIAERPLMTVVTVQAAAILLLTAGLVIRAFDRQPPAEYRTLSLPAPAQSANGPLLHVVFDDELTAGEIRDLLARLGGRVVAGPSGIGAFTVELDATSSAALQSRHPSSAAAWLRSQPGVLLAEPIESGTGED
jgi:hypothetical protein